MKHTSSFFGIAFFLLVPLVCVKKTSPVNSSTGGATEQTTEDPGKNSPKPATNGNELPVNWPWRGICLQSENSDATDVAYLASIGVNFLRIQVKPTIRAKRENSDPTQSFWEELKWADQILDECKKHGMTSLIAFNHLVLDPNKKIDDKSPEFWNNKTFKDSTFKMVEIIANRYKNRGDELTAYEVIGEPAIQEKGERAVIPPGLEGFYKNVLTSIRKYDQHRWFLLTPGPWGKPTNYNGFKPYNISDSRLIYGAHMYLPDPFTHQGVKGREKGFKYPGTVRGEYWDQSMLKKKLDLVHTFEKKYNYPVYIGEFQAARWSDGADQWAKDVLKICDEFHWSWSMFAYEAGTEAWDPFYDVTDRKKPSTEWEIKFVGKETPLWKFMISEYGKNKLSK